MKEVNKEKVESPFGVNLIFTILSYSYMLFLLCFVSVWKADIVSYSVNYRTAYIYVDIFQDITEKTNTCNDILKNK